MKQVTIIIAGGSASGKSTVAHTIANEILKNESVAHLAMDSYYKDFSDLTLDQRRQINFDHPSSLDIELLCQHLDDLCKMKSIEVHVYDFTTHSQSGKFIHQEPADVVILDGILALHIEEIRRRGDIKLFIKTDDDIRFIRRMERDIKERGRDLDDIIHQFLESVRPMHKFFVEPSIDFADVIIPYYEGNKIAIDLVANTISTLLKRNQ